MGRKKGKGGELGGEGGGVLLFVGTRKRKKKREEAERRVPLKLLQNSEGKKKEAKEKRGGEQILALRRIRWKSGKRKNLKKRKRPAANRLGGGKGEARLVKLLADDVKGGKEGEKRKGREERRGKANSPFNLTSN